MTDQPIIQVQNLRTHFHTDDGTLKADDPSTPDVNEAWEEKPVKKKRGRPPKKKDS